MQISADGFAALWRDVERLSPEQKLWLAVLCQAISIAVNDRIGAQRENWWLLLDTAENVGTCIYCCTVLDICPQRFRRQLSRWMHLKRFNDVESFENQQVH